MHFRRICTLLLLGGAFYRYVLIWFITLFKFFIALLAFCLVVLSIIEGGVLKSPSIGVELSVSPDTFVSFGFMYFGALLFNIDLLNAYYIPVTVQDNENTVAIKINSMLSLRLIVDK